MLDLYIAAYIFFGMIKKAKIFKDGQSQAILLPKEFQVEGSFVYINRVGDTITLTPESNPWAGMIAACGRFSDDFMSEREELPLDAGVAT